jgi:hypothetical protein
VAGTLQNFSVEKDRINLPRGAVARARRVNVTWRGKAILGLSQGDYRNYIYPLFSPAGVLLTAEAPIDHPHHQSVTIGADHVNCYLPYSDNKLEEANYSFYVNYIFQGRAPGRIAGVSLDAEELAIDHLRLVQRLQWQGPEEWGAPSRRIVAEETRTIDIHPGDTSNILDIRSELRPAQCEIRIGPTRHAYLTVRMAEGLRVLDGGAVVDSAGRRGSEAITGHQADWVDASGAASGGGRAGVAVLHRTAATGAAWGVADYGTITVNPFLTKARALRIGEVIDFGARLLAHDGAIEETGLETS